MKIVKRQLIITKYVSKQAIIEKKLMVDHILSLSSTAASYSSRISQESVKSLKRPLR